MTEGSEPFIIIDNVSKNFNGSPVLKNVNARLGPGEILGLIGKSGAGKSVLIHMLRGSVDYKPDEGRIIYRVNLCDVCGRVDLPQEGTPCSRCGGVTDTIEVDYWNLNDRDPIRLELRSRIAIMLQRTFALYGEKTVIENIFEALGEKMDKSEKVEKAIELLKMVNLTHRTTHIARDLSGGEKQRVVLARQLAKDPIIFLADEPTGTLDPQTAEIVHKTLVNVVKERKIAMVVSSHWPDAIKALSDYAMWLHMGEIKVEGNPDDVANEFMKDYKFIKAERVDIGIPVVKVDGAKKYYFSVVRGVVKAVDGVSLEICEKEIFALVGISGAGKTTLSRMIAGITPATDGKVMIRIGDGMVDMSEPGPEGKGRATQYIGFLHQEYTLYPFDNILRNLSVCIGMKMPAELAKMKAIQVLKGVGFEDQEVDRILYAYPDALSVGERQRIAFAQVLIKEPRLVILDEPTGTMDPITKLAVAKSVLSARKKLGETFLVVSHDMDFVMNCCDRAALMKGGKNIAIGEPKSIISHLTERESEVMLHGGVED